MNVLVTGGAGFIGSHLVDKLLEDGHRITALDLFTEGKNQHVRDKKTKGYFRLIKSDISRSEEVKPHFFKNIDWVFHLAGRSNIVPSIEDPVGYHHANVTGTINILEASRYAKIKKFVYAASSSCYGIPDKYPTSETAEIRPQYPYAFTKYLGEQYVLHYHNVYKLPVVSLRLFNVYGPRIRTYGTYGPVFSIFLAQKLKNKPFTVVGDGSQARDFTYVTDVVDAFITAAKSDISGEVFNVGSGGTYSVNDLVKLIGGPVIYIPRRPGEPNCTFADITKIKRDLHWKPNISFKEGIEKVMRNISYWEKSPVWTPSKIRKATKDWFKYLS